MNPLGLDPTRFVVACEGDGSIAGFGQLLPHDDEVTELRSLFVKPRNRGAGIGRELVRQLVQARGSRSVYLLTPAYRTNFYEACGFRALPPWQLPRYMLVDIALGSVVLAIVARSGITCMLYQNGSQD